MAASDLCKLVHHLLHNGGGGGVVLVGGLAHLEVHIGVLCSSAQGGILWAEAACSVRTHQIIIHHLA